MKKILIISALLLLVCVTVRAESIPQTYDYGRRSFQWFQEVYNGSDRILSSNSVVILDMRRASGTYEGFAAYATYPGTTGAIAILGVADEDIATGKLGRVCVRGPHQVKTVGTTPWVLKSRYPQPGDMVMITGTPWRVEAGNDTRGGAVVKATGTITAGVLYPAGIVGYRIGSSIGNNGATTSQEDLIWIWVQPQVSFITQVTQQGDTNGPKAP